MRGQQVAPGAGGRVLTDATVQEFKGRLRGELLRPGDDGYDGARTIHNGMIDRRPDGWMQCARQGGGAR